MISAWLVVRSAQPRVTDHPSNLLPDQLLDVRRRIGVERAQPVIEFFRSHGETLAR